MKSYQGNCDLCFKKSDRKIFTILKESPEKANWWKRMEDIHGNGYFFYRKNRSIMQMLELSKQPFEEAKDESLERAKYEISNTDLDISNGCSESCEPF